MVRSRGLERAVSKRKLRDGGFAAVDALVALTILATTLALALHATATSRSLAARALQSERAGALLQYLLQAGSHEPGQWSGRAEGFDWRLDVALQGPDPHAPALRTCRRTASAREQTSGRRFSLSAVVFCKAPVS
jgi:hypothetical protein